MPAEHRSFISSSSRYAFSPSGAIDPSSVFVLNLNRPLSESCSSRVVDEPAAVTSGDRHREEGCSKSGDRGETGSGPIEGRLYLSSLGIKN